MQCMHTSVSNIPIPKDGLALRNYARAHMHTRSLARSLARRQAGRQATELRQSEHHALTHNHNHTHIYIHTHLLKSVWRVFSLL
jgi:hypothetical protein